MKAIYKNGNQLRIVAVWGHKGEGQTAKKKKKKRALGRISYEFPGTP